MATTSSYLRYLPPVLWQSGDEPPGTTGFGVGTFLVAFEKVLTGLDERIDVPPGSGENAHTHDSIATKITAIPQLFDPWRTPTPFLPWLAQWVALTFPMLQDTPLWDEYQKRKATAEIAGIYRLRGLKDGLNRSLDLFSVIPTRPRVTIDDGNKLLATTPAPVAGMTAPVTAFVSQGPTLTQPISTASHVVVNGLVRPQCIAPGSGGNLFIGDRGAAETVSALQSRVWRLDATGTPDTAGTPPLPRPLAAGTALTNVVAVAVSPPQAGRPETLYFVDNPKKLFSLAAPYNADSATLEKTLPTVAPMAMAVDTNGDILVLDRGNIAGEPPVPAIVVVRPGAPDAPQTHALSNVVEPLSLLVRGDGSLIIGDGRHQDQQEPGNLVRVDRANWTGTPLLASEPTANPLVSPTAVVGAPDGALFVLDAGLRPFPSGESVLTVARPAAVFRADVDSSSMSVFPATRNGNLVFPTGMATQGDRLLICDPGQPPSPQQNPVLTRLSPFQFSVVVHFESSSLPDDDADRTRMINRIFTSISDIVDELRPAHTFFNKKLIIAG